MKIVLIFLLLLTSFNAVSNEKLDLAYQYLEFSKLKKAIPLFEDISDAAFKLNDAETYIKAQLGLAEAYIDLGTYNISIKSLNHLILFLDANKPGDYLSYAKAHQLLADNYDFLFLFESFLRHSKEFIRYYRLLDSNVEIYEALYHTYLGRYYNIKYDLEEAYKNTSKALDIYHRNKASAHLVEAYKIYEGHNFTLRNHPHSPQNYKYLYADSLKQKVMERFPYANIKRARAITSMTAVEMDQTYIYLNKAENLDTKIRHDLVTQVNAKFKNGISEYHKLIGTKTDYLPRFYALQSYLHTANKNFDVALNILDDAKASYSCNLFVKQAFAANSYRVLSILRFDLIILNGILKENPEDKEASERYLESLLLFEKFWEKYLLDEIQDKKNFTTQIYNENPYQYLFEYFANSYLKTKNITYLHKAHEYEEKTKYSALLTMLPLSDWQKAERHELLKKKDAVSLVLDVYYLSNFLGENQEDLHQRDIQKKIDEFNTFKAQSNLNISIQTESINSIQSKIHNNTAQISYTFVGYNKFDVYAKVITKDTVYIKRIKNSTHSKQLTTLIDIDSLYQAVLQHDVKTFKSKSYKLYQEIFEPITGLLPPHITKIEIIPYADISNLPFDLLITEESSSNDFRKLPYLVHKYAFNYSLSASIKKITGQQKHKHNTNLAIYNPDFNKSKQSALNYAAKVSKQISKAYNGIVFSNTNATIDNFKKSLLNTKIVTLFSHGVAFNDFNTTNKGIYFQDGFLNIDTIYNLGAKTDFLILSACQTGNGFQERGEGNINLVRAFSSIGVKSLLIGNWEIDEETSLTIVNDFFNHLETGLSKSEALNKAKKTHLNTNIPRYGNPLYWAGLNIVGDNATISLKPSDSKWYSRLAFWLVLAVVPIWAFINWFKKRF